MEGRANIQIGGCFANTLKINVLLLAAAYYSKMSFFSEKAAAAACLGECRGGSPGQPLATYLLFCPQLREHRTLESSLISSTDALTLSLRYSAHLRGLHPDCVFFLPAGRF